MYYTAYTVTNILTILTVVILQSLVRRLNKITEKEQDKLKNITLDVTTRHPKRPFNCFRLYFFAISKACWWSSRRSSKVDD